MDASHLNPFTNQKHNIVYIEKKNTHTYKNIPTKRFFLKHYKNCLKSDLKYAKYRNQSGKIPRENGIKDKFFFF